MSASDENFFNAGIGAIADMLAKTDENGVLYIPGREEDDDPYYKCEMNWKKADAEKAADDFEGLCAMITFIEEKLKDDPDIDHLPFNARIYYDTYLRDFETGDIDAELIAGIIEKNECGSATESEKALYDRYYYLARSDAERRLGGGIAAFDVIVRAMRLYRLFSLDAPDSVVSEEARHLAQAIALNGYCEKMEPTELIIERRKQNDCQN